MAKLTRRKLITQVSIGAGATGVLAITAACAPSNATTSTLSTTSNLSGNSVNTTDDPLAVFVTDPTKGILKVMKDDREITITNPSLVQTLLSLGPS